MLNLSDKELDRLSKEAAQEYEPGEVLGPRSWERLEVRLDNTPGGANPNPLRHIRRFPFYYAPALLVLIGVSYYFVKQGTKGSGSPPTFGLAKTPAPVEKNLPSTTNPVYSDKSTTEPSTSVNPSASGSTDAGATDPRATVPTSGANAPAGDAAAAANTNNAAANANNPSDNNAAGVAATAAGARSGNKTGASNRSSLTTSHNHNVLTGQNTFAGQNGLSGRNRTPGQNGARDHNGADVGTTGDRSGTTGAAGTTAANAGTTGSAARELKRSAIGGLASTKNKALIPDSNLRKFTLKSLPQGMHQRAMYVNRNLQIGFVLAPDFTSVNSLAGNRPGSTVGLTLDYQFANHWYIGSGLLLDRKNYAARAQDFHAPPDFRQNNIVAQHLDYVKGTFEMLEIPLNLRYDFSVTGSTLFFASAGVSSYLMTSENSNMYGNPWGYPSHQPCPDTGRHSYLFSAATLSLGVETGLSNSLSLLIAPYMKIPTRGVGFGQVQMSSVGINFALKFAPVISRKRK
jgi:cytoskeletal protein RodZ